MDKRINMEFINTNNRKRIILTAALVVILIPIMTFSIYFYLLPGIASFLTVQTNLQQSDVIIILGGDSERVSYGVGLYTENYSDNIIMTGGLINVPYLNTTWAELQKKEAVNLGVLPEDIILARTFRTSFIKHSIFHILSPSDSKSPTIHQSYLPPFSPQSHQVEFPIP